MLAGQMQQQALLAAIFAGLGFAAPSTSLRESKVETRSAFPFNKLIAFGDDFTDNGLGSWGHGITGNEQTGAGKDLWGADTWTDGLVPVSVLANSLGMPLSYDYAFGSSGGGATVGSVCNTTAVPASEINGYAQLLNNATVPDTLHQIQNYTSHAKFKTNIGQTLHFMWTGNNDMIASLGWIGRFTLCDKDTLCVPGQNAFVAQLVNCMSNGISNLLRNGAEHIIVPNIYPRNLAPWTSQYISNQTGMIENFGTVIAKANTGLQNAINTLQAQNPNAKIMYYDVNSFITKALVTPSMVQGATYNFTCVDGCGAQVPGGNWNIFWNNTVTHKQPDNFFWMTTVMPSATVLKAIAADMYSFLQKQY